jgi:carbonic anhydrase
MKSYEILLKDNQHWAARKLAEDPGFFQRLLHVQSPEFLWIGCSDSRVPPDQITQTEPGEIFIHRNVANLVVNTDVNVLSVIDYAVNFLKIKHIVVCGHYGCGGIQAALSGENFGQVLNMWFRNIKDIYRVHREELDSLKTDQGKLNRLVELNVIEQVFNLAKSIIIQKSWSEDKRPDLHGWVYDLHDGLIKPLVELKAGSPIDPIYQYHSI